MGLQTKALFGSKEKRTYYCACLILLIYKLPEQDYVFRDYTFLS